jgi:hypothetical protein
LAVRAAMEHSLSPTHYRFKAGASSSAHNFKIKVNSLDYDVDHGLQAATGKTTSVSNSVEMTGRRLANLRSSLPRFQSGGNGQLERFRARTADLEYDTNQGRYTTIYKKINEESRSYPACRLSRDTFRFKGDKEALPCV